MTAWKRLRLLIQLNAALAKVEKDGKDGDMKKLLPSIVSLATVGVTLFVPEIQAVISTHPAVASVVAGLWAILSHFAPAPGSPDPGVPSVK